MDEVHSTSIQPRPATASSAKAIFESVVLKPRLPSTDAHQVQLQHLQGKFCRWGILQRAFSPFSSRARKTCDTLKQQMMEKMIQFYEQEHRLHAPDQLLCDEGDEGVHSFDISTLFAENHEPVRGADRHIVTNHVAADLCSNDVLTLLPPAEFSTDTKPHPYASRYLEEYSQIFMMDSVIE